MKYLKWVGFLILLLCLLYIVGPRPIKLSVDATPLSIDTTQNLFVLEQKIDSLESNTFNIKPDNQARIVWVDSVQKNKTKYAIVYLHGFSASQAEGYPVHRNIATRYGCNLYLSRLYAHGLNESEPLRSLTAEELLASAKEAIAIGKQIGEQVILMSTSTGGTLSLILSSEDPDISGLILYSPNVDLYDSKSFLLTQPWGVQLAKLVVGSSYYTFEAPEKAKPYWNTKYRVEALIELKRLMNATMNSETFKKIKQPVFVGYFEKDNVVSVSAMLNMFDELGTKATEKRIVNFPHAQYHAIASSYWTNTSAVEEETCSFLEEVMNLNPVKNP